MTQATKRSSTQTSTNFSTQVDKIIATRKETSTKIATAQKNFQVLLESLTSLKDRRDRLIQQLQDKTNLAKLRSLDLKSSIEQLQQQELELKKLYSRFGRDTLNIAVVGMAGQGKSRLLQTLTGLSDDIIPARRKGDCTAVRSNIHHRPELGNAVNIKVKFHDEKSFLKEVIVPYYKDLNLDPIPKSIDELLTKKLPQLSSKVSGKEVAKAKYKHLKKYYENLPNYLSIIKGKIKEIELKNVNGATIKQYVTQGKINNTTNFGYLAVREVDIFCSFPNSDVGRITFVDMPGLGDNKINNSYSLLQTLREDIDFVLFLHMPGYIVRDTSSSDSKLYDLVNKAIPDLPINKWSFYIFNNCPQLENKSDCHTLKAEKINKNMVAGAMVADCSNVEETKTKVLAPVLKYLTKNIQGLDEKYSSACQEKLLAIQKTITENLDTLSFNTQTTTVSNFGVIQALYIDKFNELFKKTQLQLSNISIDDDTDSDESFKNKLQNTLESWKDNLKLPTLQDIQSTIKIRKGRYKGIIDDELLALEGKISAPFNDIDESLKANIKIAREQIIDVLIESGKLNKIATEDRDRFLTILLDKLPEGLEDKDSSKTKSLRTVITELNEYSLNYKSRIVQIINRHSEKNLRSETKLQDYLGDMVKNPMGNKNSDYNNEAKKVLKVINEACDKVIRNSREEIAQLANQPPEDLKNMVSDFIAGAFSDNDKIKDDWRKFLGYHIEEIWFDEFGFNAEDAKLKQEWMQVVDRAKQANNIGGLSFL